MITGEGYELVAFALSEESENLDDFVRDVPARLALLFGAEGAGLTRKALAAATRSVVIPMDHGIDSLNVATAAALALYTVRTAQQAGGHG